MPHYMTVWYVRKVEMLLDTETINTFWSLLILLLVILVLALIVYSRDDIAEMPNGEDNISATITLLAILIVLWIVSLTLMAGILVVLQKYNSFNDLSIFMVVAGIITSIIAIYILLRLAFIIKLNLPFVLDVALRVFILAIVISIAYYLTKFLYFATAGKGYEALLVLCSTGLAAILLKGLLTMALLVLTLLDDQP